MKDEKDIDKLFKDGLDLLRPSPSPRVWEGIQKELQKDGNRPLFPLWLKLSGIAASLALLIGGGSLLFFNTDMQQKVVKEDKIENQIFPDDNPATEKLLPGAQHFPSNYTLVQQLPKEKHVEREVSKHSKTSAQQKNEGTATSSKTEASKEGENSISKESVTPIPLSELAGIHPIDRSSDKLSDAVKTPKVLDETNNDSDNEEIMATKPSLIEAIAEQERIKENTEVEERTKIKRWQVNPNVAPVYYNGFGGGSSLDPQLSGNPTQGDVNLSYGIQVSYAVNKKLKIRTGVNNVDLSYATGDVILASAPIALGLKSVEYSGGNTVITALNRSASNLPEQYNLKSNSADARLVQEMNYIEVPLEMEYVLLDKRFGIHLIGGLSTLFLDHNEISVKAGDYSSFLGSANNLSDVSFSTNVGFGMNYKLSPGLLFNVEPMFKYQINPYTNSGNSFKPYYLGVYSGLSLRF